MYITLNSPIINLSQKVCDVPFDFTPPPPPDISTNLDSSNLININVPMANFSTMVFQSIENCESGINSFQWTKNNNHGADDAVSYRLYFQPFLDSAFSLLQTFNAINDTTFEHQYTYNGQPSVAGCYYVTAIDSAQYNNESTPSDKDM